MINDRGSMINGRGGLLSAVILSDGRVALVRGAPNIFGGSPPTLSYEHAIRRSQFERAKRFLGFRFERVRSIEYAEVPMWFPTLLLAALTAWTWRKRRSEGDRGFAVEGADQVREESGEKREANHH
jgi:hypothetical protein